MDWQTKLITKTIYLLDFVVVWKIHIYKQPQLLLQLLDNNGFFNGFLQKSKSKEVQVRSLPKATAS